MISLILFSYLLLQPRHAAHSANVRCGLSGAVTVSRKSSDHRIYLEGRLQRDSTQNLADLKPPMLNPNPTQNLRTDKPWIHSAFGLDGNVQTLLTQDASHCMDRCVQAYHIQHELPGAGI